MKAEDQKVLIIGPILKYLNLYSESAVILLLATAAHESHLGKYIRQMGYNINTNNGGFGLYQCEMLTHDDIWLSFLKFRPELAEKIEALYFDDSRLDYDAKKRNNLMFNTLYSTAIARVHYLRVPEKLPEADNIEGVAEYWKKYYNTKLGKGTCKEFIENYNRFVGSLL